MNFKKIIKKLKYSFKRILKFIGLIKKSRAKCDTKTSYFKSLAKLVFYLF